MTHAEHTNQMLQEADPFDRAFVDEMVPHHRGAIAMANVVLDHTKDRELSNLANRHQDAAARDRRDERVSHHEVDGPVPEGGDHRESTETSTGEEHDASP